MKGEAENTYWGQLLLPQTLGFLSWYSPCSPGFSRGSGEEGSWDRSYRVFPASLGVPDETKIISSVQ